MAGNTRRLKIPRTRIFHRLRRPAPARSPSANPQLHFSFPTALALRPALAPRRLKLYCSWSQITLPQKFRISASCGQSEFFSYNLMMVCHPELAVRRRAGEGPNVGWRYQCCQATTIRAPALPIVRSTSVVIDTHGKVPLSTAFSV